MQIDATKDKVNRVVVVIMLVMSTLLHGYSVADKYATSFFKLCSAFVDVVQ